MPEDKKENHTPTKGLTENIVDNSPCHAMSSAVKVKNTSMEQWLVSYTFLASSQ